MFFMSLLLLNHAPHCVEMHLSYVEYFFVEDFGLCAFDVIHVLPKEIDLETVQLLVHLQSALLSVQNLHVFFKDISFVFNLLKHELNHVL
jgi:hypothetical protein